MAMGTSPLKDTAPGNTKDIYSTTRGCRAWQPVLLKAKCLSLLLLVLFRFTLRTFGTDALKVLSDGLAMTERDLFAVEDGVRQLFVLGVLLLVLAAGFLFSFGRGGHFGFGGAVVFGVGGELFLFA